MELLEKYLDHPQRDQIIAREMGWTQLLNGDTWTDEVDALLAEESSADEYEASVAENNTQAADGFEASKGFRVELVTSLLLGPTSASQYRNKRPVFHKLREANLRRRFDDVAK